MNRINGNVIIVDSAMGNNLMLTSANQVIHLDDLKIQTISFVSLNTSGSVILTNANTSTDVVFSSNIFITGILVGTGGAGVISNTNPVSVTFPLGFRANDLKVPTLTAGTAYIYLA